MIELTNDSDQLPLSMADKIMKVRDLLTFNWHFGRQSGGSIVSARGDKWCLPFVAASAMLTKTDLANAFVKTTDPLIKASSQLTVVRSGAVLRTFPITFAGESQLRPPMVTPAIYLNAAAGNPGFARQAGTYYEFSACYVDANGKTQAGEIAKARTDLNSTISNHYSHVYVATPSIALGAVDNAWADKGALATGVDFPAFIVVPYDQVSGKEVTPLNIPASPVAGLTGLVADKASNHKPAMYASGTSTLWTANCEVCFGVVTDNGAKVLLTSDIVTIAPAASKQFYPSADSTTGNGWNVSLDQQTSLLEGIDQLLKHTVHTKVFMKVKAMLLWRPAGQTKWSRAVSFTANNEPLPSFFQIPAQSTYVGVYDEALTLPKVNRVAEVKVSFCTNSEPLGVVGDGPADVKVFRVSTDANTYLLNPFPQVVAGYPKYERNAQLQGGVKYGKYDLGSVPAVAGFAPCGVVTFAKNLNLSDDLKHPKVSPTGDAFFNEGERVRIDVSVPLRTDATGAEWFVRTVTRNISGSESRGSWSKMSGSGFNNQYLTSLTSNATLPNTNTTLVRPGSYDGVISWGASPVEEFVLLPGDQLFLSDFTYVAGSGKQGDANSAYATPGAYNRFDIGLPITLLE